MSRLFAAVLLIALVVTQSEAQQGADKGSALKGAPPAQPPLGSTPKPAIPNSKPVRTCESLTMVALPNTTIESAKIDANNANVCRVTAITTHPPAGDKVRIWVAIPMSNWNGRFMGTGGGGFVGGSEAGVNQPIELGYAGGATDTGHAGGSGNFAMDPTPSRWIPPSGVGIGKLLGQNLNRDRTIELRVHGAVDRPHPALA
jgi:hypothetical protein